jgi:hypothetical protein
MSSETVRDTTYLIVPRPTRHERRAVLGPYSRPVVLVWPNTIIFYFTKNHIYICTIYIQYYKHLNMMFYWLDSFA